MAKRPYEHVKAQHAGRERDAQTCQICGDRHKVEGHHIIDYQYGGAANKDNIITLCHECHDKVHQGKIQISKF